MKLAFKTQMDVASIPQHTNTLKPPTVAAISVTTIHVAAAESKPQEKRQIFDVPKNNLLKYS